MIWQGRPSLLLVTLATLTTAVPHHLNLSLLHRPHSLPGYERGGEGWGVMGRRPQHLSPWIDNDTLFHHPTDLANTLSQDKDGKFIFTVIQFPNVLCGSGINSGTCFTATECILKGGTTIDSCASGYGTCCQVKMSGCGGDITVNNTVVTNTEYDGTFNEARNCIYKVAFDDTPNEICQIRYEFIDFDFQAPSTLGVCSNDKLVFENDRKSAYFCGKAPSSYHWYVETAGTTSPQSFSISTDASSYNRKYAIRVSTIPCMQEVPTYCGQYYDGTNGTISSFNYNNGVYLAGLMYSICFRKNKNYCTYTLKPTTDNQYIGTPDSLRLPMGEEIPLVGNPAVTGSAALCPNFGNVALFYSVQFCLYASSMTSTNRESAFYVTVNTLIDTTANRNPLDTSKTGFSFDWTANSC